MALKRLMRTTTQHIPHLENDECETSGCVPVVTIPVSELSSLRSKLAENTEARDKAYQWASELESQVEQQEEARQILRDACDRDWKDEDLLTTARIASNAICWRNSEIWKLREQKAASEAQVAQLTQERDEYRDQMQCRNTRAERQAEALSSRNKLLEEALRTVGSIAKEANEQPMYGNEIDRALTRIEDEVRAALLSSQALPTPLGKEVVRDEGICDDCHRDYTTPWFTANELWNRVIGDRSMVLCVSCFMARAEKAEVNATGWELVPEKLSDAGDDKDDPLFRVA